VQFKEALRFIKNTTLNASLPSPITQNVSTLKCQMIRVTELPQLRTRWSYYWSAEFPVADDAKCP